MIRYGKFGENVHKWVRERVKILKQAESFDSMRAGEACVDLKSVHRLTPG
jgi:hypothetical protein